MKLISTTQSIEVNLGEVHTTTQPTYQFETCEVLATTLTPISNPSDLRKGSFNDNTWVTNAVTAPAASDQKGVTGATICNIDTVAHTIYVRLNDGGSYTYVLNGSISLAAGQTLTFDGINRTWSIAGASGATQTNTNLSYASGLFLDTTAKFFEVLLDAAPATSQLDFMASISDVVTATLVPSQVENHSTTNSTTPVTVVAAPAAGHTRILESFSIFNNDTVQRQVTFRINDGVNTRIIKQVYLQANQALHYDGESGWYCVDKFGNRK